MEKDIQREIYKWVIRNKGLYPALGQVFFSTQNGLLSNPVTVMMAKKTGLKKGVPDLLFLCPNKKFHGMALEIKTSIGAKRTDEQREFIQNLKELGYHADFYYRHEDATEAIEKYCKNEL